MVQLQLFSKAKLYNSIQWIVCVRVTFTVIFTVISLFQICYFMAKDQSWNLCGVIFDIYICTLL